jgi:hypothetical protein
MKKGTKKTFRPYVWEGTIEKNGDVRKLKVERVTQKTYLLTLEGVHGPVTYKDVMDRVCRKFIVYEGAGYTINMPGDFMKKFRKVEQEIRRVEIGLLPQPRKRRVR